MPSRTVPLLIAAAIIVVVHIVTLSVVYTIASGWDEACPRAFERSQSTPLHSGWRVIENSVYIDPGFTCEFHLEGEALVIRTDLVLARNLVLVVTGATVVIVILEYRAYRRGESRFVSGST